MLIALNKRLAPTDQARKIQLANQYAKLKKYNKSEPIEQWLQNWEKTYADAVALNLPDVADDRSLFDFTQAIRPIDAAFASTQDFYITQKTKSGESMDLYDLIEDFRNHYRRTEAYKPTGSHSAFATFKDENQ